MKDILEVRDRKNKFPVAGTEIEEVLMQRLPKLDKHAALRGGGGERASRRCLDALAPRCRISKDRLGK